MTRASQERWGLGILLGLVVLSVLPALRGEWLVDDLPLIAQNRHVHALSWENVAWAFTHDLWDIDQELAQFSSRIVYYRPLVLLSYALDWVLGAGTTTIFHVTNLVLHLGVTVLAVSALSRWLGKDRPGGSWLALVGGALYALHPAKMESVAWISGRPDSIATLGILVACEGIARTLRHRRGGVALSLLGAAIGYLSKETTVVLPVLALAEIVVERRERGDSRIFAVDRASLAVFLPQAVLAVGYLGLRHALLPMRPFAITGLPLGLHAAFVVESLGRYLHMTFWPSDLSLFSAVMRETNGTVTPSRLYVALGALVIAALCFLAVRVRRRPETFAPLVVTVALLAPISNLFWIGGISTVSPRFLYLPSLGIVWLCLESFPRLEAAFAASRVRSFVTAAGALGLAALALLRSLDFSTERTFWNAEAQQNPDVPFVVLNVARLDSRDASPELGLARNLCGFRVSEREFSYLGSGAYFLQKVVQIAAQRTSDLDTATLVALERFLRRIADGQDAALDRPLHVLVPSASKTAAMLRASTTSFDLTRSDLLVRVGDVDGARAALQRAERSCSHCVSVRERGPWQALRLDDVDWAERLSSKELTQAPLPSGVPFAVDAHGTRELLRALSNAPSEEQARLRARLEANHLLWGRARATLLPYEATIAERGGPELSILWTAAGRLGDEELLERIATRTGWTQPEIAAPLDWARVLDFDREMVVGCLRPHEVGAL